MGIEQCEKFDIDTGKISIELGTLVNVVCGHYGLAPEAISSTDRNGQSGRARSMVAFLAKDVHGIELKDVAAHFNRHPRAVSTYRTRLQAELGSSPVIQTEIDAIHNAILEC